MSKTPFFIVLALFLSLFSFIYEVKDKPEVLITVIIGGLVLSPIFGAIYITIEKELKKSK